MDEKTKQKLRCYMPSLAVSSYAFTIINMDHQILNHRRMAMIWALRSMKHKLIERHLAEPFFQALWNMYGRNY